MQSQSSCSTCNGRKGVDQQLAGRAAGAGACMHMRACPHAAHGAARAPGGRRAFEAGSWVGLGALRPRGGCQQAGRHLADACAAPGRRPPAAARRQVAQSLCLLPRALAGGGGPCSAQAAAGWALPAAAPDRSCVPRCARAQPVIYLARRPRLPEPLPTGWQGSKLTSWAKPGRCGMHGPLGRRDPRPAGPCLQGHGPGRPPAPAFVLAECSSLFPSPGGRVLSLYVSVRAGQLQGVWQRSIWPLPTVGATPGEPSSCRHLVRRGPGPAGARALRGSPSALPPLGAPLAAGCSTAEARSMARRRHQGPTHRASRRWGPRCRQP